MATARRSREEWQDLVERWRRSGQTRASFAKSVGVNAATLGGWRWKLSSEEPSQTFLEGVVSEPESAPEFRVEVSGRVVHVPLGFDAHELRRLMGALC